MKHIVPVANWVSALADLIGQASDGDTIVVRSASMQQLAERAKERMCPNKNLSFEIEQNDGWHERFN